MKEMIQFNAWHSCGDEQEAIKYPETAEYDPASGVTVAESVARGIAQENGWEVWGKPRMDLTAVKHGKSLDYQVWQANLGLHCGRGFSVEAEVWFSVAAEHLLPKSDLGRSFPSLSDLRAAMR